MSFSHSIYLSLYKLFRLNFVLIRHKSKERMLCARGKAKVAFIVSNLPMWHSQHLVDLLNSDPHFEVQILICPFGSYSQTEKKYHTAKVIEYFTDRRQNYSDLSNLDYPGQYVKDNLKPDIIFYPQQYMDLFLNDLDSDNFDNTLTSFIPYGFNTFDVGWVFNHRLDNLAWKIYYSSTSDKVCAKKYALNRGRNVVIVGNPLAEDFLRGSFKDIWKPQPKQKKRVVWAPHYTITTGVFMTRSSFMLLHEAMLDIAEKYKESIQFVFKPHPKLISELYKHPQWGKERTDEYYQEWATRENTQLETGEYVDLFMTSDAMIHDCGSFTAEYHYSGKPVMFITSDVGEVAKDLNQLGKDALDAHYIGKGVSDIEKFLEDVVLGGEDPLAEKRKAVFEDYLLPPNGKSAAENIYDDLVHSLGF